jgi:anhydro-N-acetylmuramic acid kinase
MKIQSVAKKKTRIVAGIMSGTSLDGIDCVVMQLTRKRSAVSWKLLTHVHKKFPEELSTALRRNSDPKTSRIDEINDINQVLAYYYADAVARAETKSGPGGKKIDLIGCHGQTVYHRPQRDKRYGKKFGATLQVGDPSTLSALTGIPVVGNFRSADIAHGGEGAPLVPYADYLMFNDPKKARLLINIGGIANFTHLRRNAKTDEIIAFDTGPGNMVIDALMRQYFHERYDRNGKRARSGRVNETLFMDLCGHPFLHRKPPKSTGREEFGEAFLAKLQKRIPPECSEADTVTTLTEFTAWSIYHAYTSYITVKRDLDEVIVSGGGARNGYIMSALREYFDHLPVYTSDEFGLPTGAKEAACFAVLANETLDGRPGNLPSVTGAKKRIPLGQLAVNVSS